MQYGCEMTPQELICDIADSGVSLDLVGLDYVEVQIDRDVWRQVVECAERIRARGLRHDAGDDTGEHQGGSRRHR